MYNQMASQSAKDQAVKEVVELKVLFDMALANKRKYPAKEFDAFVQSVCRNIELTWHDPKMHKDVPMPYMTCASSFKSRGSGFRKMLCSKPTGWSANFLPVMI